MAFLLLIRYQNVLLILLSIFLYQYLSFEKFIWDEKLLKLLLVSVFSLSAGNIINDLFDIKIDRANALFKRPLVSGVLSKTFAKRSYLFFTSSSILLSFTMATHSFFLVLFNSILLALYSWKLKHTVLIGNISVSYLSASIFLFAAFEYKNYDYITLLMLFSFLLHLIREITKDMEDHDGDKKMNGSSFPIRYGYDASKKLNTTLSLILIASLYIPLVQNEFHFLYTFFMTFFISFPLIYCLISLKKTNDKKGFHLLSRYYKFIMLIGIILLVFFRNDIRLTL